MNVNPAVVDPCSVVSSDDDSASDAAALVDALRRTPRAARTSLPKIADAQDSASSAGSART